MRRQLGVLVAATTSLVLIAFLVPLGYLVREVAEDRAVNAATREAEAFAPVVATVDRATLRLAVAQAADDSADYPLTVYLPGGPTLGADAPRSRGVQLASRGRSLVVDTGTGREVLVAVAGVRGGTAVVRSFVPTAALHAGVGRAWTVLGLLALVLLGVSVLVADRLARRTVRPLSELAATSHRLGTGDVAARVRPAGPPEVRAVGAALNRLAGRITELLADERETVADLSHRLRTPLTALRLDAEALADPGDSVRIGRDVDALVRTVDEVIRQARRPVREGAAPGCDARVVTQERVDFWAVLAEEEGRHVDVEIPAEAVPVRLSAEDLRSVLDALLGNVFAHTPRGTRFGVRLRGVGAAAEVVVADAGPGIASDDPFARGVSGGESTGLGLDIVRRTVEAVGGGVQVRPHRGSAGSGTVVTLRLPVPDLAG